MLVKKLLASAALFAASFCAPAGIVLAQAPAAAPVTLWSFLGLQRGALNSQLVNRQGNFPGCELKPPMKAIADPANLQSKNPGIKKAAEIKAEEDLAQQKIKALKYLAEVGCGCYPGVGEALLAALDDCTEAVRFEATQAIVKASGAPRTHCDKHIEKQIKGHHDACHDALIQACKCCKKTLHGLCGARDAQGRDLHDQIHAKLEEHHGGGAGACRMCGGAGCVDSCCSDDIIAKLKDMAFGMTEDGCFKEPSERVRGMAAQAVAACPAKPEPVVIPTPEREVPTPAEPKELPIPTPPPSAAAEPDSRLRAEVIQPKPQVADRQVVDRQVVDQKVVERTDAIAHEDWQRPNAANLRPSVLQKQALAPGRSKDVAAATTPMVGAKSDSPVRGPVIRQKLRYPDPTFGFARGEQQLDDAQNPAAPMPAAPAPPAAGTGVGSTSRPAARSSVDRAAWMSDAQ